MAFIAWLEGDDGASRRWQEEATELARRLATPFQLTSALGWSALISRHRGDEAEFRRHTESTATLAEKHKLPLWHGVARVYRGLAMAGDGDHADGLATLTAGVAALEEMHHDLLRVRVHVALAEACALAGRADEGLQAIGTAMGHVRDGAESWWEPELHPPARRPAAAAGRPARSRRGRVRRSAPAGRAARPAHLRAACVGVAGPRPLNRFTDEENDPWPNVPAPAAARSTAAPATGNR
ncbi:hypothetical protein HK414_05110 [Ramlibacter terrae]|uniref:MalT-like TPR region domain-containing protein n=1 Tax=Ramlibacter terrae TaxID=2732511 RepID=A0ABX6P3F8_9BURK|nr:hypothetical protein HK414_05110 [Ramlibacter terrae]